MPTEITTVAKPTAVPATSKLTHTLTPTAADLTTNTTGEITIVEAQDSQPVIVRSNLVISRKDAYKNLARVSGVLLLASSGRMATNLMGDVYIARLGSDELAAGAIISTILDLTNTITVSALQPLSSLTSEAVGNNRKTDVGIFYRQGLTASMLLNIPIILAFVNAEHIAVLFGQNASVAAICKDFFSTYLIGAPAITMLRASTLFASGLQKHALIVGTSIASVPAFYFLVDGLSARFGVAGVGYSLAILEYGSLAIYQLYFHLEGSIKQYMLRSMSTFKNERNALSTLFKLGFPITFGISAQVGTFFSFQLMSGKLGKEALIAQYIASQYFFLSLYPTFALSQSAGILIGESLGSKRLQNIARYGNAHLFVSSGIATAFLLSIVAFPEAFMSLFLDVHAPANQEIISDLRTMLIINSSGQIVDAAGTVAVGALIGLHESFKPIALGLLGFVTVSIPTAFLFSYKTALGVKGIAVGFASGMFCRALPTLHQWFKKTNHPELLRHELQHSGQNNDSSAKEYLGSIALRNLPTYSLGHRSLHNLPTYSTWERPPLKHDKQDNSSVESNDVLASCNRASMFGRRSLRNLFTDPTRGKSSLKHDKQDNSSIESNDTLAGCSGARIFDRHSITTAEAENDDSKSEQDGVANRKSKSRHCRCSLM